MNDLWVGVDIGGTKTAIVKSEVPPFILDRIEFPTEPAAGPEKAIRRIIEAIHSLVVPSAAIHAIGISCGSPLDRITGVIQTPPNLPTWTNVPLKSILESEFHVPCRLENDANAGAVAEYRFGAGRGSCNMIFITMGTGFGAGLILDGRLYHGTTDAAGEIGHVRLTPTGPVGYGKPGSVEGWASGGGIAQLASAMLAAANRRQTKSVLAEHAGLLTAKDVIVAAEQGDELSKKILRAAGKKLGSALAILIDLFNPDRIVLGGLAMRTGGHILEPARKIMEKEALPSSLAACRIVTAALGEQIGDVAAICVAQGLDK